ncbi:hypothetical protein BDN70DRAFT_186732 [Pholiota conissans]|uniref:Uncharacterized protein n=1 Tax=Pholiota conissans TaxID=109636 RepID=A0A9P6CX17_9AGAR|nr:hypothetical protein BDN70DRAFT_186732 [Pholiota conissans]
MLEVHVLWQEPKSTLWRWWQPRSASRSFMSLLRFLPSTVVRSILLLFCYPLATPKFRARYCTQAPGVRRILDFEGKKERKYLKAAI